MPATGSLPTWRALSCETAAEIMVDAPASRPISSRTTSGATAMAPMAARGWGMSRGTGTTGARADDASSVSRPPPATATNGQPRRSASAAAVTVSSV